MAFWFWVVTLSIFGLILYELVMWIRGKSTSSADAVLATAGPGDETLAELTRANMKIAVLESRLVESSAAIEEEKTSQQTLWRKRLEQTESAYQKQMAVLHERLTRNEEELISGINGNEYEVRMAGEVESWLGAGDVDSQNSEQAAEPSSYCDLPEAGEALHQPAADEGGMAERDNAADAAAHFEDSEANHVYEEQLALEEAIILPLEQEVSFWVGSESESEGAFLPDESSPAVEIKLLDIEGERAAVAPQNENILVDGVNLAIKYDAASEEKEILRYDKEISAVDAVDEAGPPLSMKATPGEIRGLETGQAGHALPDGWTDRHERALQRALARRLGSEMDADYLEDDEFLRETGLEQLLAAIGVPAGDQLEAMMSSDDWTVDPLEVLKRHLAEQDMSEVDEAVADLGTEADAEKFVTDIWEAMVYASAEEARESAAANEAAVAIDSAQAGTPFDEEPQQAATRVVRDAPAAGSSTILSSQEIDDLLPGWDDDLEDDEAIAATVEAIMARGAGVNGSSTEVAEDVSEFQSVKAGANGRDGAQPIIAAEAPAAEAASELGHEDDGMEPVDDTEAIAVVEEEPEAVRVVVQEQVTAAAPRPVAAATVAPKKNGMSNGSWEREFVNPWAGEYFANTSLSGEPVVVRHDQKIDFKWGEHAPAQGIKPRVFSVRWTGSVSLEPGHYRFEFTSPDGVRLWLNGRLVISAWYDQSEQNYRREFAWHGGLVDIRVEHYENGGDARACLTWERVDS